MAQFVSKGHDFFACLRGTARVDNDPAMIDKLWSNQVEAWFPGGRNDPKLALLRLDIASAELWETDMSLRGRLKMRVGGQNRPRAAGRHAQGAPPAQNRTPVSKGRVGTALSPPA